MAGMFERLATEVFDVAEKEPVLPTKSNEAAGRVVMPQMVLDACLGNLQDVSAKMDGQERSIKDHALQIRIMKDKMRLLEDAASVMSA